MEELRRVKDNGDVEDEERVEETGEAATSTFWTVSTSCIGAVLHSQAACCPSSLDVWLRIEIAKNLTSVFPGERFRGLDKHALSSTMELAFEEIFLRRPDTT